MAVLIFWEYYEMLGICFSACGPEPCLSLNFKNGNNVFRNFFYYVKKEGLQAQEESGIFSEEGIHVRP